ncbi:MAG: isoprenylcysteine carboxylmethyltransferase family protein [Oligoflexia bacterium]|nr:isoprenylcysteine carboxylmethyltransferase family protein [Oligoflexia bacterium]
MLLARVLSALSLVAFVGIRLVYERAWRPAVRVSRHDRREHVLTVLFGGAQIFPLVAWVLGDGLASADLALAAPLRVVGVALCVGGVALFWWVHATLGENFSPRLDMRPGHTLVTTGPYRWVRHPMYTTNLLLVPGWGLLTGNALVFVLPAVALVVMLAVRLPDEESMLAERFGDEWRVWAAQTGRLLPRLRSPQAT